MDNLELWNRVCTTDPDHVKKVNQRGGFTAIDAQYQRMKATEVFGPYGTGWGLSEVNFLYVKEADKILEIAVEAIFWYYLDIESGDEYGNILRKFPVSSDMTYKPGNDSRKKLLTDVTTKALSYLGFNADVFLGKFDDNQYVQQLKKEQKNTEKQVNFDDLLIRFAESLKTIDESGGPMKEAGEDKLERFNDYMKLHNAPGLIIDKGRKIFDTWREHNG